MNAHRQCWPQLAFAMALFASGGESSVAAAPPRTVVYPTGSFPLDVHNVQAAIDGGGTVLLKATDADGNPGAFNFGDPTPTTGSGVNINTDVAILGERAGGHMTTINGGYIPILGLVPVKSRIEGIDFETPLAAAIILISSTGTDIAFNRINAVIGDLLVFGFTDGDGIDLFGGDDPLYGITGHARVTGNVIENLSADFSNGMQLDGVVADVEISGNTVNYPVSSGFIQTIGITAFRSHNRVSITGNDVTMGPGNPDTYPAAIFAGGQLDAHYLISGNNVLSDHPNADGIVVVGGDFCEPTQHAVLSNNHIVIVQTTTTVPGGAGVSFYGAVDDSLVSANVIEGSSSFALQVAEGFSPSSTAHANRLVGNAISQHSSFGADVYFGSNTSDLLLAGKCSTAIDLGIDNRILCGTTFGFAATAAPIAGRRGGPLGIPIRDVNGAVVDAIRGRRNH